MAKAARIIGIPLSAIERSHVPIVPAQAGKATLPVAKHSAEKLQKGGNHAAFDVFGCARLGGGLMFHRFGAALVAAGLAGSAFAQNDGEATASGEQLAGQMHSSGIPVGWEGDIADALFAEGGDPLPETEIRSNWPELAAEHQEEVRGYCAELATEAADEGSDPVTRTVLPSSGATGHGSPTEDGETEDRETVATEGEAASGEAEVSDRSFVQASGNVAQIVELCATVKTL